MRNRIRKLFESIVYAGMKSGLDPLYLSNRTFAQKAGRLLLLVLPVIAIVAGAVVAVRALSPKRADAPRQLTTEELRARILPDFNKEIKLESNEDLEVTEVHFEHAGGNLIAGTLKNKSTRQIAQAEVIFDVADRFQSDLGGVTIIETNLPPAATRNFRKSIEQTKAVYALVREVTAK